MSPTPSADDAAAEFATRLEAGLDDPALQAELSRRHLGDDYRSQLRRHGLPLASAIAAAVRRLDRPLILGINGSQGSGKTTLAAFVALLLERAGAIRSAVMSIDDFYLTRSERRSLAADVHPLLATRGVPGTHDVDLAGRVLDQIAAGEAGVRIPRFDKATDDRMAASRWTTLEEPVELAILEGWCVGCRPQPDDALAAPVNALEASEDADGRWRRYVNAQLSGSYAALFDRLDQLVMLQVPGFERVFAWRLQQEQELIAEREAAGEDTSQTMDADGVARFIAHYERLTRHMLADLPTCSDVVIEVDDGHRMCGLRGPMVEPPSP